MRANPLFNLRAWRTTAYRAKRRCSGCRRRACGQRCIFDACRQRRNCGNGFNRRHRSCCRYRWFNRLRRFRWLRNRLIPCSQLLTLTRAFLFHFFKVVERRTGGFNFFCYRLRLHRRRRLNSGLLLIIRILNRFLRVSRLRLESRLVLINRLLRINRLRVPGLFRRRFLHLRHRLFIRVFSVILRLRLGRRRLLPRFMMWRLRLRILWLRRITFRRGRNDRLAGLRPRNRLPFHHRLRRRGFSTRHRRCRHNWIDRRRPGLRCRCRRSGGGNRLRDRMPIQQRIVFLIFRLRRTMAREQHIIRIGGHATRAVFDIVFIIHTLAGEKRRIRVSPTRIAELLCQPLTARQCATKDARTSGFALCAHRFIFVFVIIFILVVIDPGVIAASTVAGKGENIQQPATQFFCNAHPGPACEERQTGCPDAQQRNRSPAAVQQRLKRGA